MKKIFFKPKQNIGIGVVSVVVLFFSFPSYALKIQEVPDPRQTDS